MTYQFAVEADWSTQHRPTWTKILQRVDPTTELHFLEIGSFEGRSSVWFADNYLHHPSSTITCIDTWQGGEEVERMNLPFDFDVIKQNFIHNVSVSKYPHKFKTYIGPSIKYLPYLIEQKNKFDFVYLDGSHEARDVFYDLALSYLMLKPLGVIVFDDYLNNMATADPLLRVKPAVDAFMKIFYNEVKFVETSTRQAFLVKRP